jgi:predicted patatin/cPLA2 family phospholipase
VNSKVFLAVAALGDTHLVAFHSKEHGSTHQSQTRYITPAEYTEIRDIENRNAET